VCDFSPAGLPAVCGPTINYSVLRSAGGFLNPSYVYVNYTCVNPGLRSSKTRSRFERLKIHLFAGERAVVAQSTQNQTATRPPQIHPWETPGFSI